MKNILLLAVAAMSLVSVGCMDNSPEMKAARERVVSEQKASNDRIHAAEVSKYEQELMSEIREHESARLAKINGTGEQKQ